MDILDEKGRLFGRVNIIDALVVLFAVIVIVAGAALVFGNEPEPDPTTDDPSEATMHVTLVTGGDSTTHLRTGEVQLNGESANVTDIHRTTGPRAYLRVELDGDESDEGLRFARKTVRVGEGFTVTANTSKTGSRVIEYDVGPTFDTRETTVTTETTVRTPVANAVTEGDQQRVAQTPVATVRGVETTRVNETHSDLRTTLELNTRVVDGVPHYSTSPVRLGREIDFRTEDYQFEAEIIAKT